MEVLGYAKDGTPVRVQHMSLTREQINAGFFAALIFGSTAVVISLILWEEWKRRKDPRVGHYPRSYFKR